MRKTRRETRGEGDKTSHQEGANGGRFKVMAIYMFAEKNIDRRPKTVYLNTLESAKKATAQNGNK